MAEINQNEVRFDPQTGVPIYAPPAKESFSVADILFAWLAVLAGYAFCRVFPVVSHPFGGMLFMIALFAAASVVLAIKKCKFGAMQIVLALSAILLLPALFLSANVMFHTLVYLYALAVWCYFVSTVGGAPLERGFSALVAIDFLRALFVLPFASLGKIFSALIPSKAKGSGRIFLKVLLGIVIGVVPCAIIVSLLSYDSGFMNLMKKLLNFSWGNIFSHLFSFLFGIVLGMFFFGLYYSATRRKSADVLSVEACRNASEKMKKLPGLTAAVATLPILGVYGIFFASQWRVYLSAFSKVLPENFTYAEYAREGFFQLCAVSVINMLIISALQSFIRRKGEKPAVITRILSILYSCATLVLIATALAKLILYIQQYGLTPKRVYAGWFMVVLAVLFLIVLAKQYICRIRLIPSCLLVCVALSAVLFLSGSDRLIAKYNVDRYLEGRLESVDVDAMKDLGDAAIPELMRLAKAFDRKNGTDISKFDADEYYDDYVYHDIGCLLQDAAYRERCTFFSFTLPRYRAEKALEAEGFKLVETKREDADYDADTFDYDEVFEDYPLGDPGIKTDGFVNVDEVHCRTAERAVERAKKECTVDYDRIYVAVDEENEMWQVCFYVADYVGGDQTVYLDFNGMTQMIRYGE